MPFLVFFLLFAGDDLPVLNIEKETPQPDCWRKLCAQCAVGVCTCLCAHVRKPTTALCLLQLTEETWWWRQTLTCRYSEQSVSVRTATDTHTHISLLFRVLFLSWCFNSSVVQTSALNGNVFIKFGIAHLVEQASHMTKPYCRGLGSSLPRMLPMCYHPHSLLPFLSLTILTINIKKCQTYIYTSLQIKYYYLFFLKQALLDTNRQSRRFKTSLTLIRVAV